jgi:predicted dehydrogenase
VTHKRARIGVVGTGWWSTHAHIPALRANPDAELVGVCDLNRDRVIEVADRFDIPNAVTEIERLIGLELDAIVIATPHDAHFAPAAAAIDAGIDVLVEKPMTIDAEEAWELVRRAATAGVALHVGHTYPYSTHAAWLRDMIRRGDFGALNLVTALFSSSVHQFYSGEVEYMQQRTGATYATSPTTYADPARGGGHLFTQMTHAASVLLWITERRARRVSGNEYYGEYAVDLSDTISAILDDGSIATLAGTGSIHAHPFRVEEYRFFAADGRALLDTASQTLDVAYSNGRTHFDRLADNEKLEWRTSKALVVTALGRGEPVVSGELGAKVTELLCAARESARHGGTQVDIAPLDAV